MKNRRKSGAYTQVCEHFEEIFRGNLPTDGRLSLGRERVRTLTFNEGK